MTTIATAPATDVRRSVPASRLLLAPAVAVENKGPESYFPSIEKKYGRPVSYWIDLINANTVLTRHGQLVSWLKQEHGLGHGHANALVGYALQNRS